MTPEERLAADMHTLTTQREACVKGCHAGPLPCWQKKRECCQQCNLWYSFGVENATRRYRHHKARAKGQGNS